MTERTFFLSGLKTGDPILLALRNGGAAPVAWQSPAGGWGVPDGPVDPEDPDPPVHEASAEIVIRRRNPAHFAPDGIIFEVTNLEGFDTLATHAPTDNLYQPQFHDIEVFWDFGDLGSVYSAPESVLPEWKNRNIAKGHQAAHVYREPGTYTVTAFLVEMSSGKTATATLTLSGADVVLDPSAVFAGNKTIWVGPEASWTRAPAGALTFETWVEVQAAYGQPTGRPDQGLPMAWPGGNTRVMFASGYDEAWTAGIYLHIGQPSVFLCAEPGAEVKPQIRIGEHPDAERVVFIRDNSNSPEMFAIADGIRMQGTWNPAVENDPGFNQYAFTVSTTNSNQYTLLDRVSAYGMTSAFGGSGSANSPHLAQIIHDSDIGDWSNFGVFGGGFEWMVILGSKIAQHVDAFSGGNKYNPVLHNNHGPIRIGSDRNVIIDGLDLFSNTGWYPNNGDLAGRDNQPCLRLNTARRIGAKFHVSRCSMEGGFQQMHAEGDGFGPTPADFCHNVVVDGCVFVAGIETDCNIQDRMGGSTYRNNLFNTGDFYDGQARRAALRLVPSTLEGALSLSAPIRFYQNTRINLLSPANDPWNQNLQGWRALVTYTNPGEPGAWDAVLTVENNVDHQPNALGNGPVLIYAPIDSTPLWPIRHKGYRQRWYLYQPFSEDIPAMDSVTVPLPNGFDAEDFIGSESWPIVSLLSESGVVISTVLARSPSSGFAVSISEAGVTVQNNTENAARLTTLTLDLYGEDGYRANPNPVPVDSIWSGRPLAGSSAVGTATTGLRSASDIRGFYIEDRDDVGAWEVDG